MSASRAVIEEDTYERLDAAFEAAMAGAQREPRPLTVLFSGGVDSGLLAWELRDRPRTRLLAIGVPESPDLRAARAGAADLGTRVEAIEVSAGTVEEGARRWSARLHDLPRSRAVPLLGLALAMSSAGPGPVVCGQGADELFLGYAHFRDLDARAASERSEADLTRLQETDALRARAIAQELGVELACPYLDPGFVRAARSIPIDLRLPGREPKALFRRWALHRGLPRSVALRAKKALQYGTGIDRLLIRLAPRTERPVRESGDLR